MPRWTWLTIPALALMLAACDEGPAENAGEAVDDAVEGAADALEDAKDAVEDAAEDATNN